MEHETRTERGATVVRISGSVDVATSIELRDLLAPELDRGGARVLLDLSGVSLIDSSGVGVLVTAHRRAEAAGSALVLVAPAGPAARVFELTRTNKLLRIEPDLERGLAAFES